MLDLDKLTGFTEGPWKSQGWVPTWAYIPIHDSANNLVSSIYPNANWQDKKQTEATARLIAAAPELLEMARKAKALRDAAENVLIAWGMGWDLDGVMDVLKRELGEPNA